ncbi:hypothetical protein Emag_006343 [Eimeria magna]
MKVYIRTRVYVTLWSYTSALLPHDSSSSGSSSSRTSGSSSSRASGRGSRDTSPKPRSSLFVILRQPQQQQQWQEVNRNIPQLQPCTAAKADDHSDVEDVETWSFEARSCVDT